MSELESYIILLSSGILIRYALIYADQSWAKSYSQTIAFLLLPIITYTITKTISGNIALSLGMIGALSIVRFRHPVKSALELIIYFDLITIGIATSVRTKWSISLIILTIVIILIVKQINLYLKKKHNKKFYNISFSEGVEYNILEIASTEKIPEIEKHENLKKIIYDSADGYIYFLNFENSEKMKLFKESIENHKSIKRMDYNIV